MTSNKFKEKIYLSNRKDIGLYPHFIYQYTNIIPMNIFDIGSWNGDDAELLRGWFDVSNDNVFCFDANSQNFVKMKESHPTFNNFHFGISNFNGPKTFFCHNCATDNSSLTKWNNRSDNYTEEIAEFSRMDTFIQKHSIKQIDICKIDVEGNTYDVLDGFGDQINIVRSLQIEAETLQMFEGEILFSYISDFLIKKEFTMVEYYDKLSPNVCDSIWIKNGCLTKQI